MLKSKNASVKKLTGGIEYLFKKNGVCKVFFHSLTQKVVYEKGWGKILSPDQVEVKLNDGTTKVIATK
jgi:dihydrolipoamide dehydrogenase